MFPHDNIILIALISVVTILIIFFVFRKETESDEEENVADVLSVPYLCVKVKELFNEIVNQNIADLNLTEGETKKREKQKVKLTNAIRSCAQGNIGEREYMIDYITDLLQNNLGVNELTIDCVIPFSQPQLLTSQDKYEILLHSYRDEYGPKALGELSRAGGFEKEKKNDDGYYYEVTDEDINELYASFCRSISYVVKMRIIAQRVFQNTYGYSVADETFYQRDVDCISGGVSGMTTEQYNFMEEIMKTTDITSDKSYNSLWVTMHGKPIHFSFMGFGNRNELIRVCKNLYQYDNVGHLTSTNGYKLSYLQNGSRVVVTRPKLTSGWAFFVRKFESSKTLTIDKLVTDKNKEAVLELSDWAVKGLLNIIISGDQNSGKTTFLKQLLGKIDQRFPIRTTELEFELWANNLYSRKNVVAFRATEEVSLLDAIRIELKTEGAVMILGEIADTPQAVAFIELKQKGTKCVMGTGHWATTVDAVENFRNALLSKEGFCTSEMIAEEQVAGAIDIDIHWVKAPSGKRYISHITEVVPLPKDENWTGDDEKDKAEALRRLARRRAFTTREIITFEKGEYVFKNPLSGKCVSKILMSLGSEEEKTAFLQFNKSALNGGY
jgi:pilus assembly protein CpaF